MQRSSMSVVVLGLCVLSSLASPLIPEENTHAVSGLELSPDAWKQRVSDEVDKIMKSHSESSSLMERMNKEMEVQNQAETEWNISSESGSQAKDRPRPPKLDDAIANLRALTDKIELENVNSVANQDAQASAFSAKKAKLEALISGPQQAVIRRSEERNLCEREVTSLQSLKDVVNKAVERSHVISDMRREQSKHYTEMTLTVKRLTQRNVDTLNEVRALLSQEIDAEKDINGAVHFDPVALRQQQPEDMLRHAQELTGNLMNLLQAKVQNHEDALEKIKHAFSCPKCEEEAANLQDTAARLTTVLQETKTRCAVLAESHRALDQADREKVISLKRDLEDVETAERVHKITEESLQKERKIGQNAAQKMLGFYNNVPRTMPSA